VQPFPLSGKCKARGAALAIFKLVVAHESDFLWMLGDAEPTRALRLAPGGVAAPQTLRIVQAMTRRLFEAGCDASWLMIDDDEIVGLCSFRRPPLDGRVEIGYGVAGARTGRGFATQAVKAMLALGPRHGVTTFDAETTSDNVASQRALERSGFVQIAERDDPEDGRVLCWVHALA